MRHRLLTTIIMVAVLALSSAAYGNEIYSLVRVNLQDETTLETVRSLYLDVTMVDKDFAEVVIYADRLKILDDAGLSYSVEIEDMTAFYSARLAGKKGGVGSMGGYRTLSEIYLAMDSIADEHPDIVKPRWSIGQTLEGRDIYVMKISDNPLVNEDEPEVFYNSAIHAREVITPEVLIYFMRHLTDNYGTDPLVTDVVDNRELLFTLVENPDGYYHNEYIAPGGGGMWRKNRRDNGDGSYGIDLNRNYGYMWGYDDAGSSPNGWDETYRGTGPFSEPESQVIRDFVISRDIKLVLSYHSYSNLILWPYGYNCTPNEEADYYFAVAALADNFNNYGIGNCCGVNGYTGDWYYGERMEKPKIYEFLLEVGGGSDGFWPQLYRIPELVEENLQPNMIYARWAGIDTSFVGPPVAPMIEPIGEVNSIPLVLSWTHDDETNPAAYYDVWQFSGFGRFTEGAETASGDWSIAGFIRSSTRAYEGSYSYHNQGGTNSSYTMQCYHPIINVSAADSIRFWIWYENLEHRNYGYVEVSTDEQTWTSIPGSITTDDNPYGYNLGNGITGTSGGWVEAIFELDAYVGQTIYYRIRYVSSEFVSDGMYLDEIYPIDKFEHATQVADDHTETSVSITGLVDGDYYFIAYAIDHEREVSEPSDIVMGTVALTIAGDADGSGSVDIDDAVYLIAYIFSGGPAPDPVSKGDCDCSGDVDIDDVVYLITYIFSGGYPPGDLDGDGIREC